MSMCGSKVQLISDCFVKPMYDVEHSKNSHYLIGEDLSLLSFSYSQKGLLYKKPSTRDFNINSFVDKMRNSFSRVLVYYYPLAGRLTTVKYVDELACSIHVDCNKGPGARFIHASVVGMGVSVSDILSRTIGEVPIMKYFFELGEAAGVVCFDGHTRALVSLQVTEMDNGFFVGIAMNHSLADGTSLLHFVNSLSEIFRTGSISHVPIFRPVLPDGCSLIQKLPYLDPEESILRIDIDPRIDERIFHISSSSIAKLKSRANSEIGESGLKLSGFQALAALLWISINKAKKVSSQDTTICLIPIDCRARFNPPISSDHIGNLAQGLMVTRNVGELIDDGLGSGSKAIHQNISAYDDKVAIQYLKASMDNPSIMRLDEAIATATQLNIVNFSGATRFDFYGVDFGLGKAVANPSGTIDKRDGMVVFKGGVMVKEVWNWKCTCCT